MNEYQEFLNGKRAVVEPVGFDVAADAINPKLFPFQRDIVRWALRLGRAALFEECGLGKTAQYLEWARHVVAHTNAPVLILAPLAVAHQVVREGDKFGIPVEYARDASDLRDSADLYVTNYERLDKFVGVVELLGGVVLDESSIMKNLGGKTFWQLVRTFEKTRFKLCCTATPAPNEFVEFTNHSTFLGIMHFKEALTRWFTGNQKLARSAVLKKHAAADWWRWLTSWSVCLSKPADLGAQYDMPGYELPELRIHEHALSVSQATIDRTWAGGMLIPESNPNSTTLHKVKRESLADRVARAVEIVRSLPDDAPVIVWCDTNYEADALIKALPDAVEVRGSHAPDVKEARLNAFGDGDVRILITKPDIAGFGLNWQHCADMVFVGVSFSFEKTYQALRRSYRFGQTRPVNAHLIYAESEGNVLTILRDKQKAFDVMQLEMRAAVAAHGLFRDEASRTLSIPASDVARGTNWTMYLGDCVTVTEKLPDNSVDYCVHSPPFGNLYIYSDSEADMGNSADDDEFFAHYEYLIKELFRVTTPGRLCSVHCKDLPAFKNRDGAMGLRDFPGEIIRRFEAHGWQYHSRVTIWKDPVIEMERTNNHGLLHRNFKERAEVCRMGMADYVITFRKWTEDADMVTNGKPVKQARQIGDYIGEKPPEAWEIRPGRRTREENYSIAVWQRYASPVWMDINQLNVLNYEQVKDPNDEKHICPLQLDVIARCIDLWTNPGDVVFSPFAGIGSEGYQAIKQGRKFVGIELKPSYWHAACKYLGQAEYEAAQIDLFQWAAMQRAEQTGD